MLPAKSRNLPRNVSGLFRPTMNEMHMKNDCVDYFMKCFLLDVGGGSLEAVEDEGVYRPLRANSHHLERGGNGKQRKARQTMGRGNKGHRVWVPTP